MRVPQSQVRLSFCGRLWGQNQSRRRQGRETPAGSRVVRGPVRVGGATYRFDDSRQEAGFVRSIWRICEEVHGDSGDLPTCFQLGAPDCGLWALAVFRLRQRGSEYASSSVSGTSGLSVDQRSTAVTTTDESPGRATHRMADIILLLYICRIAMMALPASPILATFGIEKSRSRSRTPALDARVFRLAMLYRVEVRASAVGDPDRPNASHA